MLPNAQEHFESLKKQQTTDMAAQRRQFAILAQAEVLAEHMTQVQEWNLFLSYISAAQQECDREIDKLRTKIADPMVVDHDEVMRLKVLLEGWMQRKNAFEAVISLPKDLMEMGAQARTLMERLPELETAA